jgi:hypothetical protein
MLLCRAEALPEPTVGISLDRSSSEIANSAELGSAMHRLATRWASGRAVARLFPDEGWGWRACQSGRAVRHPYSVLGQRGELGEQAAEALRLGAVRESLSACFGEGRRRAAGGRHDVGGDRFGLILEQERRPGALEQPWPEIVSGARTGGRTRLVPDARSVHSQSRGAGTTRQRRTGCPRPPAPAELRMTSSQRQGIRGSGGQSPRLHHVAAGGGRADVASPALSRLARHAGSMGR